MTNFEKIQLAFGSQEKVLSKYLDLSLEYKDLKDIQIYAFKELQECEKKLNYYKKLYERLAKK